LGELKSLETFDGAFSAGDATITGAVEASVIVEDSSALPNAIGATIIGEVGTSSLGAGAFMFDVVFATRRNEVGAARFTTLNTLGADLKQ
jgi:hypothetical protein